MSCIGKFTVEKNNEYEADWLNEENIEVASSKKKIEVASSKKKIFLMTCPTEV